MACLSARCVPRSGVVPAAGRVGWVHEAATSAPQTARFCASPRMNRMDRRTLLTKALMLSGAGALPGLSSAQPAAPAVITRDAMRPQFPSGVQSGDARADSAIVWTRSDRPARLWVEWSSTASFANVNRVRGPHLLDDTDFT